LIAVDFFARGLHTRTAVARLPFLRQLGFLVVVVQLVTVVDRACNQQRQSSETETPRRNSVVAINSTLMYFTVYTFICCCSRASRTKALWLVGL